jgi:hypothetical protein
MRLAAQWKAARAIIITKIPAKRPMFVGARPVGVGDGDQLTKQMKTITPATKAMEEAGRPPLRRVRGPRSRLLPPGLRHPCQKGVEQDFRGPGGAVEGTEQATPGDVVDGYGDGDG